MNRTEQEEGDLLWGGWAVMIKGNTAHTVTQKPVVKCLTEPRTMFQTAQFPDKTELSKYTVRINSSLDDITVIL